MPFCGTILECLRDGGGPDLLGRRLTIACLRKTPADALSSSAPAFTQIFSRLRTTFDVHHNCF